MLKLVSNLKHAKIRRQKTDYIQVLLNRNLLSTKSVTKEEKGTKIKKLKRLLNFEFGSHLKKSLNY
jgi:hypothetical protein